MVSEHAQIIVFLLFFFSFSVVFEASDLAKKYCFFLFQETLFRTVYRGIQNMESGTAKLWGWIVTGNSGVGTKSGGWCCIQQRWY